MKRTHTCGELCTSNIDEKVVLSGWVDHVRNLGGIIFLSLRDRYGKTQLVFSPDKTEVYGIASSIHGEDVISVTGTVNRRPDEAVSVSDPTGGIEIDVFGIEVLSRAETPPIYISIESDTSEEQRLKYRFLDLRTKRMQKNMILRHNVVQSVRNFFNENNFIDIETPVLNKSTPEGARDFLVPSRMKRGKFYALPQSPQLFKQLLMVSGFDRYYQIAKCFRDEDLRADRQLEFSQIDYEMSFVEEEDVMDITERMVARVFKDVLDVDIKLPLERMDYETAMNLYGSDKPDLRYDLKLVDVTECFAGTEFSVISSIIESGGCVKGITLPGKASGYSRKKLSVIEDFVKVYGAKGMMNIKSDDSGIKASFGKNVDPSVVTSIVSRMNINDSDIAFLIAGDKNTVNTSLGALRQELAKNENLINKDEYRLLWVVKFPMFEYSEEDGRYVAKHHPFTMPYMEDVEKYSDSPEKIRAKAYDIVMNGWELGGGSIRIHDRNTQKQVFEMLKINEAEQEEKFGFLLSAFKYGVPPHGGCALGLARFVALLAGEEYIRDVIAFPKTTSGTCLMTDTPSAVKTEQLDKLYINIKNETVKEETK